MIVISRVLYILNTLHIIIKKRFAMNEKISREQFLKATAMASAALLVSSLEGWAASNS